MNSFLRLSVLLLIAVTAFGFSGCTTDDDTPIEEVHTGKVWFKVYDNNIPAYAANVDLAIRQRELLDSVYVASGITDGNGFVEIGNLETHTYSYRVSYVWQGIPREATGTVDAVEDEIKQVDINF